MNRPAASSAAVERRMKNTRRRDTPKELELRQALHHRGWRYIVDAPPIPNLRRRADIIFRGPRVAVFVDGCFWHSCPKHASTPESNRDWWKTKLADNVTRDRDTDRRLREGGWRVVRIWEHEALTTAVAKVERALCSPTGSPANVGKF